MLVRLSSTHDHNTRRLQPHDAVPCGCLVMSCELGSLNQPNKSATNGCQSSLTGTTVRDPTSYKAESNKRGQSNNSSLMEPIDNQDWSRCCAIERSNSRKMRSACV
ncbi:hypothetical protein BGZ61DRAFT_452089 [Ilyonectria robusta]|uniref:uncharacterized protein n=1 Tax=Ilyonectria robusta TaxID=1079257 RepID=UPI001E8E7997|nr:uncharacterized protein BGZ61DRAFT_452089 [Ilyonectria robusta]KAH8694553.1 hypothetical protein BGZ61DRAFT_452089 [Ilyonectria robusta]